MTVLDGSAVLHIFASRITTGSDYANDAILLPVHYNLISWKAPKDLTLSGTRTSKAPLEKCTREREKASREGGGVSWSVVIGSERAFVWGNGIRETDRQTQRQTYRDRLRDRDRKRETETERDRDRQTDRQRQRENQFLCLSPAIERRYSQLGIAPTCIASQALQHVCWLEVKGNTLTDVL